MRARSADAAEHGAALAAVLPRGSRPRRCGGIAVGITPCRCATATRCYPERLRGRLLARPACPRAQGPRGPGAPGSWGPPIERGSRRPQQGSNLKKKICIFVLPRRTRNSTGPLGLGGLGWDVCFQRLFFSTLRVSTLWGGVYPSPYPLPGALDPRCRDRLGFLIAIFLPYCCASFFHRFFDAVLERSWLDFASQLGSQNPPKSMKNRCQDAFPS